VVAPRLAVAAAEDVSRGLPEASSRSASEFSQERHSAARPDNLRIVTSLPPSWPGFKGMCANVVL
jgi:hypothetical protein